MINFDYFSEIFVSSTKIVNKSSLDYLITLIIINYFTN